MLSLLTNIPFMLTAYGIISDVIKQGYAIYGDFTEQKLNRARLEMAIETAFNKIEMFKDSPIDQKKATMDEVMFIVEAMIKGWNLTGYKGQEVILELPMDVEQEL